MNFYNALNRLSYNGVGRYKYNSVFTYKLKQLLTRIGHRPIVLDQDYRQVAILENSFDVILEQEVGGMDEISFSLPMDDNKRQFIANESYIQMFDTIYVIREILDRKKSRITEVFAEAIWYDLQYADVLEETEWEDQLAGNIISSVLKGTGWRVGTVAFSNRRSLKVDISKNRLEVLGEIENLFNGELVFDTQARTVSLALPRGEQSGASIMYDKNADDIEARYDTKDLITRLYVYGKNDLSIEEANNGVAYVENHDFSDRVRVRTTKDERFTNPYHLKEVAEAAIETLSKPRTSYTIKMAGLSSRSGLEHEQFKIGSIVRIYDKELGIDIETRIMKWSYNVIEPYRTELTLENKAKTLSDLLTGVDDFGNRLESGDSVDKAEMLDLSVFNYLLNARGDDGMAYWESNGWTIDPSSGSSGNASFKAIGELGTTKEMYQTVYPSNHDNYAISFRSQSNNLKVSDTGRVGVEVTVRYEDGSEDVQFISLID